MPALNPEVQVKIHFKHDDKGIKDAERAVDGFGGSLRRIGEIAAGVGLARLGEQMLSMGKSALVFAVNAASGFEQAQIGFTTLLKDGNKARALMKGIAEDAARTPFNLDILTDANRFLIAAGIGADQSRKDVLALANAVSAVGKGNPELTRLAMNLQQIKSIGKAAELDLKQFGFAGIPIYQLLSESMGKSVAELKEMEITYDDIVKALDQAQQKGGMFESGLQKQAGSFQVLKSNIADILTIISTDILQQSGLFDALKNGLASFGEFLKTNKEEIVAGFQSIGAAIMSLKPVLDVVISVVQYLATNSTALNAVLVGLGAVITAAVIPPLVGVVVATWPVIAIFAAAAAATYVLLQAWESNFLGIRNITENIVNQVIDKINMAIKVINFLIDGLNKVRVLMGKDEIAKIQELGRVDYTPPSTLQSMGSAYQMPTMYGSSIMPTATSRNTTINMSNTFNTPTDVNAFAKSVGFQLNR